MLKLSEKEVQELYSYIKSCALADCVCCTYTTETFRACPTYYWGERFGRVLDEPGVCALLGQEGVAAAC